MKKPIIMLATCSIALVGMGNSGCDRVETDKLVVTPKVQPSTNQVETVEQFTVTSKGTFKAGYDDCTREIFILRDNFTGEEYLGVTDCTLIRRKKAKDEAMSDAIETAVDIAVDVASE